MNTAAPAEASADPPAPQAIEPQVPVTQREQIDSNHLRFLESIFFKTLPGIFSAAFFRLRLFFFGAAAAGAAATSSTFSSFGALPDFFFFHEALARLRDSLKLVEPDLWTSFTCWSQVVMFPLGYRGNIFFPGRVLFVVLVVPHLTARPGDQLVYVGPVLGPDSPEQFLVVLRGGVLVPQAP